jgi:hypothetical protein
MNKEWHGGLAFTSIQSTLLGTLHRIRRRSGRRSEKKPSTYLGLVVSHERDVMTVNMGILIDTRRE